MKFGNKEEFYIEYILKENPYSEKGVLGLSWGALCIYVGNLNLCRCVNNSKQISNYINWNLIYPMKWFKKSLKYIMEDNSKPTPFFENNAFYFHYYYKNLNNLIYKSDADRIYKWLSKHALIMGRGGGTFPNIVFYRVGSAIEISWYNEINYCLTDWTFTERSGCYSVSADYFFAVINNVISRFAFEFNKIHD